jgi:hypothetical protein
LTEVSNTKSHKNVTRFEGFVEADDIIFVGFKVLTAVSMKIAALWVETPRISERARRFGGT